jgi:hypothetical protein
VAEWLAILDKLAQVDVRNESVFAKISIGAVAATIVTAVLLGLGSIVNYRWGLALALPVGAAAAYLIVRSWQLRSLDLNDGFRTALTPFLKIIAEDLDPKRPVELRLDLSGPTKDKIVSKETIPPGRFGKVVRTVYEDPWCRLTARMANHGKIFLAMSDIYRMDTRRYRTGGKIKWKKVWKKKVRVTAGLIPGSHFFFDRAAAEAVAKKQKAASARKRPGEEPTEQTGEFKLQVVRRNGVQVGKLTRKYKFRDVNKPPKDTVSPDDVMGMFFKLASVLRPARQRSVSS